MLLTKEEDSAKCPKGLHLRAGISTSEQVNKIIVYTKVPIQCELFIPEAIYLHALHF